MRTQKTDVQHVRMRAEGFYTELKPLSIWGMPGKILKGALLFISIGFAVAMCGRATRFIVS